MRLGARTWPEVRDAEPALLAVPLGSCEQHGPHLPLDTDTRIAVALADRLAAARPAVLVAPALAYGASGEHAGFDGTLSIGQAALQLVLIELIRSADAFAGTILVNGHGGNTEALAAAVRTAEAEERRVLAWSPSRETVGADSDAHAGRTETSLLLALAPAMVRTERAEAGAIAPLATLMPELRRAGVGAVSPNGVLGDPTGATAGEGAALLTALAADLVAAVDRWRAAE
jgi:mycofactocin precursor peptide peptidase